MCRALYTLEHGAIASKPVCAVWAIASLDAQWEELISWASAWQRDLRSDRRLETLSFIRFTLERSQQFELEGSES
jgi:hypothetical protein